MSSATAVIQPIQAVRTRAMTSRISARWLTGTRRSDEADHGLGVDSHGEGAHEHQDQGPIDRRQRRSPTWVSGPMIWSGWLT